MPWITDENGKRTYVSPAQDWTPPKPVQAAPVAPQPAASAPSRGKAFVDWFKGAVGPNQAKETNVNEVKTLPSDTQFGMMTDTRTGKLAPAPVFPGAEPMENKFSGTPKPVQEKNTNKVNNTPLQTGGMLDLIKGTVNSDAFKAGIGDVTATAGGALEWLGAEKVGSQLKQRGELVQKENDVPMKPYTGWRSLLDPDFYETTVLRGVPFTMSLIPAGIIGAYGGAAAGGVAGLGAFGSAVLSTLGATALTRPIESALEAGGTFNAARANGMSDEEAEQAADEVFKKNLTLAGMDALELGTAFLPIPKGLSGTIGKITNNSVGRLAIGAGRIGAGAALEGVEEGIQESFQRQAMGDDRGVFEMVTNPDQEMKGAMAVGGIFGAGFGTAGTVFNAFQERTVEKMSPEQKVRFERSVEQQVETGVPEQEAAIKALDDYAETEEGKTIIQQVTQEVSNELVQGEQETINEIAPGTMPVRQPVQEPVQQIIPQAIEKTIPEGIPEPIRPQEMPAQNEPVGDMKEETVLPFLPQEQNEKQGSRQYVPVLGNETIDNRLHDTLFDDKKVGLSWLKSAIAAYDKEGAVNAIAERASYFAVEMFLTGQSELNALDAYNQKNFTPLAERIYDAIKKKDAEKEKPEETVLPQEPGANALINRTFNGWNTPVMEGKEDAARLQGAGLPSGKFISLDRPFESDIHDATKAKQVSVDAENVFDPDGLIDHANKESHSAIYAEMVEDLNKKSLAGIEIRQGMTDFLKSKGFDSYVRGIDGDPNNRELIIFDEKKTTKQEVAEQSEKPKAKPIEKPAEPQKIDHYQRISAFRKKMDAGEYTAAEVKEEFKYLTDTKHAIIGSIVTKLNTMEKFKRKRTETKTKLAKDLYDDAVAKLAMAASDSYSIVLGQETREQSLAKMVEGLTDEKIQAYQGKRKAERDAKKKAIENPETLDELQQKKYLTGQLTEEEQVRYDELVAIKQKEIKSTETVTKVSADVDFSISQTKHTKTNEDIWVVKANKRVEKDEFTELRRKMGKLGGTWSNFTKGFNFKSDPTELLNSLKEEGRVQVKTGEKTDNRRKEVADKLRGVADNMQKGIDEKRADRLTNTAKRAREAAGAAADADKLERIQKIMRNIAEAIEAGNVTHLDGISARTHVETLESILHQAKNDNDRKNNLSYDKSKNRPVSIEDVDSVKLEVTINKRHATDLLKATEGIKGVGNSRKELHKALTAATHEYLVDITRIADSVVDLLNLAKKNGKLDNYDYENINRSVEDYKRLKAMGIDTNEQLRSALREYFTYREGTGLTKEQKRARELKEMERGLIGTKIEGYFPTPKPLVEEMLEKADIEPGMKVLEPSAGKGNIAEMIREQVPEAELEVVEWNGTLRNVLEAKEFNVVGEDFLQLTGEYDRIVMNPPFENGQDMDHVKHAYELLKPGGRVVSIMSAGPFFRGDKKATAFREWLDELGGTSEKNQEGAFKSSERSTGVATRTVVIDKPGETIKADRDTYIINRVDQEPFVIKRGDEVKAFIMRGNYKEGNVTGISHAKNQIRVNSQWFEAGAIYPPDPKVVEPIKNTAPLSNIVDKVNKKNAPPGGWNEADTVVKTEPVQPKNIKTILGNIATAKTERGTAVETQYAVIDADDLVSSHTAELTVNPDYPQDLQPRDRSRIASADQINTMMAKLEPEFLGESPKASEGAPIVGPDMVVESGNARVITIKKLYNNGHKNGEAYQKWIMDNAEKFGLDTEALQDAKNPVLVRIRQSDVDRVQFTQEANEQAVAAMSATEQAMSDSKKMTTEMLNMFVPNDKGEIETRENIDFIRAFIGQVVSPAERARYVTADASLSQEGVLRIKNAVFAKAYGDTGTIQKLAESTDNNVKNITNAMLMAAPKLAKIKEQINNGSLYDLDITEDIAEAANKLSALRKQEMTVQDYLSQTSVFGEDLSPLAKDILDVFDKNSRSAKRITGILYNYAEGVIILGDPRQETMFSKVKPTKPEVFEAAVRKVESQNDNQITFFQDQAVRSEVDSKGTGEKGTKAETRTTGEKRLTDIEAEAAARVNEEVEPFKPSLGMSVKVVGKGSDTAAGSDFSFSDPDVEARWQEASKGVQKPKVLSTIWEGIKLLAHKFTREFEHLPHTAYFSQLRFDLLKLQKQKAIAGDRTLRLQQSLIVKMNEAEFDLFTRKVVLDDLSHEEGSLPFGFTQETLAAEKAQVDSLAEKNELVSEAVKDRKQIWEGIKTDYVGAMKSIGFDVTEKMSKEDYFRHQVLEYANAERAITGTGKKLRTPTGRGFLKQREGSEMDINVDYLQAEYEVMAQMLYDIEVAKTIKGIDDQYNILNQLKTKALQMNDESIMPFFQKIADEWNKEAQAQGKIFEDENGEGFTAKDAYRKMLNTKIAIGISRLAKAAAEGMLPDTSSGKYADLIEALANSHLLDIQMPEELSKQLFGYAAWILKFHGGEGGSGAAATIFKGIKEKKDFIRETLGDDFVTWRDIIPEGYDIWQPREGTMFYMANSVPEQVAMQLYQKAAEEIGITGEQLQKVLAKGSRFKEFVVKVEIAETLENLGKPVADNILSKFNLVIMSGWKQWQLLSPRRFIKYNLRNFTEIEAVFTGNPSTFKRMKQSVEELAQVYFSDRAMTPEMREYFNRGGLQSTLQVQELGDINKLKMFMHLQKRHGTVMEWPTKVWQGYWKAVRTSTDFREAILRYASYLDYLEQMQNSESGRPKNFGASIADEVMGLNDIRDRAYKLSNDLLGAYDSVSALGQDIRRHFIPFWSFQETNMRRYTRMIINASRDNQLTKVLARKTVGAFVVKSPLLAYRVGKWAIKASGFWIMLQLYNLWMFPDEEKDLPPDVQSRPHIILGRDEDGKVRYFDRLGVLGDFVGWFGMDTPVKDIVDFLDGRRTIKEIAIDMAKSPVNKVAQGAAPFGKLLFESATGRSLFPDVFKPGTVKDVGDHIARSFGIEHEFRAITGRPSKPYSESLSNLVMYKKDPGESAYYYIQDEKRRFLKKIGKGSDGSFTSPRSEALRSFKLAIRYKDKDAAYKYLTEYVALGGTKRGLEQSLKAMEPLYGLNKEEQVEFVKSLRNEDKERLLKAIDYYKTTLLGN